VIHYICFACKGLVSWINYFYPKHEADCLKGAWNAIIFFSFCLFRNLKEMIFVWFQGFSEAQLTKLKKNEQISAEREREIDQVI
jgi:hypothetical protein